MNSRRSASAWRTIWNAEDRNKLAMIAPVFANAFDLADRIGDEVGEQDNHPMMHLESPDFEVAAVTLTSARAVIIKRKHKNPREGLRSVS